MGFLYALLFLLGLAIYTVAHLIAPIIIVKRHKTYPNKTLWIIAVASGLFGFTVSSILSNDFFSLAGIFLSSLFTLISYMILDKHCSTQIRIDLFHSADADIREKLKSRRAQGELTSTYIKRLIREDMQKGD